MLNILLFSFLFNCYHKMVSFQNDDTRGRPPPISDATDLNACNCNSCKNTRSPCFYRSRCELVKVNLHSIRFSYVFFTFLLLLDKVCAFSSAFLCVHIRTNQTVTYWTKVFPKKFFVKGYSSISKYRSYRSYTKFLNKIFINI